MADFILFQQPNGEWAKIAVTLDEYGRASPQVSALVAPDYVAGRYYTFGNGDVTASVAISAASRLMLYYVDILRPINIASMFARVVTGQTGGTFKTGIWRDLNGRPTGSPVAVDNTGVASAGAGNPVIPIAVTLSPARYWIGTKHTATSTLPTFLAWHGSYLQFTSNVGTDSAAQALASSATGQSYCFTVGDTYANDMPDLTSASLTAASAQGTPVLGALAA